MANYFQAINDKNTTQIDDNTARLHLTRISPLNVCGSVVAIGEGSGFSLSDTTNMLYDVCVNIPLNKNEQLMSIRITDDNFSNGQVCIVCLRWVNNLYRIWLYSMKSTGISYDTLWNAYAPKIQCYFWGDGQTSNDTYGLQLFNEKGQQIFHSSDYVMDILSSYTSNVSAYYSDHRNHPTFNLGVNNTKSLLIDSNAQVMTYYMGHTNMELSQEGWSLNGLYVQNGVYKLYSFYVNFWYRYNQDYISPNSRCTRNQMYVVDVPY